MVRFFIALIAATSLNAQLQLGVERPLTPVVSGSIARERAEAVACVPVSKEQAVIWNEYPADTGRRTMLTWLDSSQHVVEPARQIAPPGDDAATFAASDGNTVAVGFTRPYNTVWRIDLIKRDGRVTRGTYHHGTLQQIASNGAGYLVLEQKKLTLVDSNLLTIAELAIADGRTKIVVLGGRYLVVADDLFGTGAHFLDEKRMALGPRIHLPARGPDALFIDAAATRRGLGVLWIEYTTYYGGALWLGQFDSDGKPTVAPLLIAKEDLDSSHVVTNGESYLVLGAIRNDSYSSAPDPFVVDASGHVRSVPLPARGGLRTLPVAGGSDLAATILWTEARKDSQGLALPAQVYASSTTPQHWRVVADAIVSIRDEEQFSPRMIELAGRTYVAWLQRGESDQLLMAALNADRSAIDGTPVQIATRERQLQQMDLSTDGTNLFVSWGERVTWTGNWWNRPARVGVALLDPTLRLKKQVTIDAPDAWNNAPLFAIWDGIAFTTAAMTHDGAYVIHRFSAALDDLGESSFTTGYRTMYRASALWTGNDSLIAYLWVYVSGDAIPTLWAIGYGRAPHSSWDTGLTYHETRTIVPFGTPAIAASPSSILFGGNGTAVISRPSGDIEIDTGAASRQPHAEWSSKGWFLLTSGSTLLRISAEGTLLERLSLGDEIPESVALESSRTLIYEQGSRLYLRSIQ